MPSVSEQVTTEQRQRVTEAVKQAESKTSAEIVPVLAASSGRYDRPEDIVGLWVAIVALIVTWLSLPDPRSEPGAWDGFPSTASLLLLILSVVVGFVVGAILGSRVDWLRRLFTPRRQMLDEVEARARQVFFDRRVHHTEGASGLLVYVSLFEHLAVVLSDQAILEKLGQPTINDMCARLTEKLRSGAVIDAICDAVTDAGDRLAPVLPRAESDVNELPDALVIID